MSSKNYIIHYSIIIGGLIGALFSILAGSVVRWAYSPRAAYFRELNGDGIPDLVVETTNRRQTAFLGKPDGTYERLEQGLVLGEQPGSIEEKLQDLK